MMCYHGYRTDNGQGMRMLPEIHVYAPEPEKRCATKHYPEPDAEEINASIGMIQSRKSTVTAEAARLKTTARRLILIMLNKHGFDCSPFIKVHRKHGRR